MSDALAATWWGHSSVTVELGGVRVLTDPLLGDRLLHLRRHGATPRLEATRADVVLVSHLHGDHLHLPSLRRVGPDAVLVVPRGAGRLVAGVGIRQVREVVPGEVLQVVGIEIEVLSAHHDGRRLPGSRHTGPALGFRVRDDRHSWWYPGDTGAHTPFAAVAPVDLALVPIGGWGPSLGEGHLGPEQAVQAIGQVGARWALPVHYGTFWPIGMERVNRANHHRLFVRPAPRFAEALAESDLATEEILPAHGERVVLVPGDGA